MKKLLMITGDRALAQGKKGPFYYMLEEFSKHWERVDIICPRTPKPNIKKVHDNVYIHSSQKSLICQPWFILKKGVELYKEQKFNLFTVHSYPPFYNDIGGRWLHNKIKSSYFIWTVICAISCSNTSIINHLIQSFCTMVCCIYRPQEDGSSCP